MTLIERIEAATGPDRELFWEAFNTAFPEPAPGCEPVWRPENPKQPIYHAWKTRQVAFRRFVDAEAWEQAAILLVPEGLHFELTTTGFKPGATVCGGGLADIHEGSYAATPALALFAAALRAREVSHEA